MYKLNVIVEKILYDHTSLLHDTAILKYCIILTPLGNRDKKAWLLSKLFYAIKYGSTYPRNDQEKYVAKNSGNRLEYNGF